MPRTGLQKVGLIRSNYCSIKILIGRNEKTQRFLKVGVKNIVELFKNAVLKTFP